MVYNTFMCPYIFHSEFFPSYIIFICLGIIAAFLCYKFLANKTGISASAFVFYGIAIIVSVLVGFIFARLFQMLYNYIESGEKGTGITFFGGLIGGVATFFVIALIDKKHKRELWKTVNVAAPCIALAHSLGRIGCFFAGCCYGKKTNAFYGVRFVEKITQNGEWIYGDPRIPTQLFEAIFLLLLFAALLILILRFKKLDFAAVVYIYSYAIFRFFIEFIRDDPRGAFVLGMSPSQLISLLMIIGATVLCVFIVKKRKTDKSA